MHLIETMVSSGKADLGKMFPFAETVLASSYKTIFCCEFLGVRRIFSSHPIRHSSIFCLPLLLFLVSLGFLDPFLVCLREEIIFIKKNPPLARLGIGKKPRSFCQERNGLLFEVQCGFFLLGLPTWT